MNIAAALIGSLSSIIAYVILFAAIYKLVNISNDLREIKEMMREQKRDRDTRAILEGRHPAHVDLDSVPT